MKFTKQWPYRSGWYWCIDIQYPVPEPVFVQGDEMWKWGLHYNLNDARFPHWRFGDAIEKPPQAEVEYER